MLSTIVVIGKDEMVRVLERSALSDRFTAHMLAQHIRIGGAVIYQMFRSAEERLARTLQLLRPTRQWGKGTGAMPTVTQASPSE